MEDNQRIEKLKKHVTTLEENRKMGRWRFALYNGVIFGLIISIAMVIFDVFISKRQEFWSLPSLMTLIIYLALGIFVYGFGMYWFYGNLLKKNKQEIKDYEARK